MQGAIANLPRDNYFKILHKNKTLHRKPSGWSSVLILDLNLTTLLEMSDWDYFSTVRLTGMGRLTS